MSYNPDTYIDLATNIIAQVECNPKLKNFTKDQEQLLIDLLEAAGFSDCSLVRKTMVEHCLDQDGSRTGETFTVNEYCPYTVKSVNGKEHYRATVWLNATLRQTVSNGYCWQSLTRDEKIHNLAREIVGSRPMIPIRLTKNGDMMLEYPSDYHGHARDAHTFTNRVSVGIHQHCKGEIQHHRATADLDVLVCCRCYLRVLFPKKLTTYGDLRRSISRA